MKTFVKLFGIISGVVLMIAGAVTFFMMWNVGFSLPTFLGSIGMVMLGIFICGLLFYLFKAESMAVTLQKQVDAMKGEIEMLKRARSRDDDADSK